LSLFLSRTQVNEVLDNQELAQLPAVIPVTLSSVSLGTLQAVSPATLVSGAAEMAREVSTTETDGIYVAVVELVRMNDGACISRASAECGEEKPWNTRAKYARRSMAQTRATGKACRLAFSWIMSLAGYEVTPAEEMTPIIEAEQVQERPTPAQRKTKNQPQTQTAESISSTVPEPQSQRITASQHKLLEAQIRDYGLARERVKTWLKTAWKVEHLTDLSPVQFEKLLVQLEKWAAQEYAKAEAASALSRDTANF
jgi:hypothetical protein